jgi:hypothetical protein
MLATTPSKNRFLLGITIMVMSALFFIKPIAQNPNYHLFADQRTILSIEHFWNVVSNIPFFVLGLLGMFFTIKKYHAIHLNINSFVFYLGIFLTALGSMYYHHEPCSQTLVWDRLPMTISFMAFFSIIIGDYICITTGKRMLFPLLLLGIISIIYWQMTKSKGHEDLRFYVLIQFLPIILIPIVLILFKNDNPLTKTYWYILMVYVIAKVCEANDEFIFHHIQFISGHSLKHLAAGLAPLLLLHTQYKLTLKT